MRKALLSVGALLGAFLLAIAPAAAQPSGQLSAGQVWGNPSASSALASPASVAAMLDRGLCATVGNFAVRTAGGWVCGSFGAGLSLTGSVLTTTSGTGTVTSVALAMPGVFSVSGSPITTSGTLSVSLANQTPNTVWAGPPSAGPATPGFRALVTADLPFTFPLSFANGGTNNGSLIASAGGVVWSDATKLNVLAGTATAGQMLQSGSSATPAWSTATFPATAGTAANVLRSNGTNFLSAALAAADLSNGVTGSGAVVLQAAPALTGLVDLQGVYKLSTESQPAQITADQNDYNPGSVNCSTSATLIITSNAARNITGLAGGVAGCEMRIINSGSFAITLKDENAGSVIGNRFGFGADLVLASKQATALNYDGVNSRWRTIGGSATSTGAGVTSVVCNGLTITTSGTCPEPFGFENCSLAASVGSSLLTVALKDATGADPTASSPCRIGFRSSTAATGSQVSDSVTGALNISTNAIGATLGSPSNRAFRFWVVAFDNGGTVTLALFNASTSGINVGQCFPIDETQTQSSTAISGSATSAGVYYTPNGTTLSGKAIKILGYVEYNATGLTTAGTYATGPSLINTFGRGTKKPCEVVQANYSESNPNDTTTSATFVATSTNLSITPTSAANSIRAHMSGVGFIVSSGTVALFRMSRGTTANTNMFGASSEIGGAGTSGTNLLGLGVFGRDKPNVTSSQAYAMQFLTTGGSTGGWGNGQSTAVLLEEIME